MQKWNFDNTYAKLPSKFYTRQNPTPAPAPKPVIFNHTLAEFLDTPLEPETLVGNTIPQGAKPLAQAYMGHQFGHLSMLGDGRAILLGEQINHYDERFDIQLKGCGQTPYSRNGDGRAALGPMLREYIISEAMYALGIPTTRSLAVVETGERVIREKVHRGAVLTRVAASHIRVGTFEYAAHYGGTEDIYTLAEYTIKRHFPHVKEDRYLAFLRGVIKRQAFLLAKWQLVGFIHGVMNTDNMVISGETIDYGPCAFMDTYHPNTVFSSIDTEGRYAYNNQPKMAAWNLARFAETLLPLLHEDKNTAVEIATTEIKKFWDMYQINWLKGMCNKLGLYEIMAEDEQLVADLLQLMQEQEMDYTNTFRTLTLGETPALLQNTPAFFAWEQRWQRRISYQQKTKNEVADIMKQHNPSVIPRNYNVEEALTAAENGNLTVMHDLLDALKTPYAYTTQQEKYVTPPMPSQHCGYKTFCGT